MLLRLIFSHLLGAWLLLSFFPRELRAEEKENENEDAPLQLCGRDFIRAMIFICGASRWKKVSMVQEEEPKQLFDSQSNEFMHGRKEELIPQLNRQDRTEDLIPNMEKFLIGFDEFKEAIEKSKNEIKTTTPLKQYDLIWGTHSRKKRDEVNGIAYNCCHASCTKKQLASFC